MKRTSSGRGSYQLQGVLQPRDADFTPNNRQSTGFAARRSYIPKMGQMGSAKGVHNRMGRASTEKMARTSFVAKRLTPVRTNTPSSLPPSASRLSSGSGRSSGIGASSRKDPRFINDPAYKTQCINAILDFLRQNGYNNPYNRRTLLTPSTKDFTGIFTFIFQYLDPSYTLPTRFEDEIPKILKKLHSPIQLTKSSFVSVGSPHTWPAVLASLAYLVDIISLDRESQDPLSSPSDLDVDDVGRRKLDCCIALFKCKDEGEIDACLETFSENTMTAEGVSNQGMMTLNRAVEEAECELKAMPDVADELEHLHQCKMQYSDDLVKMDNYLQDLKVAIQNKMTLDNNAKQVISELKTKERKIFEEIEYLKGLQTQEGCSDADLIHLKYRSQEAGAEIEHQEHLSKELHSQVWEKEVEMGKAQSMLRNRIVQFESFLETVGIREDFHEIIDVHSEELNVRYDDLIEHKKKAMKTSTQTQSSSWEKDEEVKRTKEILQERMVEHKKLETKMRHTEEEHEITREEMAREEQLRMEELELLHQKIIEARKRRKKPLRQLQDVLENKNQELENYKRKEAASVSEGYNFLMKLQEEIIPSNERKRKMIREHTSRIDAELDILLAWLDSSHKEEALEA